MDRKEILDQLLELVSQDDDSDWARSAEDCAGVLAETRQNVVELWGNALLHNAWLIPETVLESDYEEFRAWAQLSAGHFALGYMLACWEQRDLQEEGARLGSWNN